MRSLKAKIQPRPSLLQDKKSKEGTLEKIHKTHTDEMVIAVCGPIGSPLQTVSEVVKRVVESRFLYKAKVIKLSRLIEKHAGGFGAYNDVLEFSDNKSSSSGVDESREYSRIRKLIESGDRLREKYGKGVLVELGIAEIHAERIAERLEEQSARYRPKRACYIFDSIKNQEELEVLRSVYGNLLVCIGVFSPLELREKVLRDKGMKPWEIHKLIDQDSGEEFEHGQTVRDTFPQADFFLKADSDSIAHVEAQVVRLLYLVTKTKIVTPTIHETAMHTAAASSYRSACLSRQVGASITDVDGNLLGVGWNDVPKAGGGLYGEAENSSVINDFRCMKMTGGNCHNDKQKQILIDGVVAALIEEGYIEKVKERDVRETVRNSKVKDLIEFSRAVHAEMLAIINAAQETGVRMRGGRIYCTTYPCHACARHIVAAGIVEIYYIEPYRKSLAITLHGDALTEGPEKSKVRLIPYFGVAPRRYADLFESRLNSRKKMGIMNLPAANRAPNPARVSLESIPVLEGLVLDQLKKVGLISGN